MTRDHTRIDRIFVCNNCKAPRSYGWLKNTLIGWAIVAFIIYAVGQWAWEKFQASNTSRSASSATAVSFKSAAHDTDVPAPAIVESAREAARAKPKVVFAAPKEVVQYIAPESEKPVVKCSTTVTDHCSE